MRNQVALLEHDPPLDVPLIFPLENFMFKFTSHPLGIPDTLASTTVHFLGNPLRFILTGGQQHDITQRDVVYARVYPPNAVMTTP